MNEALSLVQRHHLSLQSMQKWLDSAAALLQKASSGVELEKQTECVQELAEMTNQEQNFTAALEELKSLNPLLMDFMESGAMEELRQNVETMQLRKTDVKQQLDAHREVQQRCVPIYYIIQIYTYSVYRVQQ